MNQKEHLSDSSLLRVIDGELSEREAIRADAHVSACSSCRARKLELEAALADFVNVQKREMEPQVPPAAGPRALLRATLDAHQDGKTEGWLWWLRVQRHGAAALAAGIGLLFVAVVMKETMALKNTVVIKDAVNKEWTRATPAVFVPDAHLTPGATVLVARQDVCSSAAPKNRMVPVSLQQQVLDEYGVGNAEPKAYEVDYLITPALGGADDIRNLWPQSYGGNGWNARVKDALEDRLHDLVCSGDLDLATAQREISTDWIAAYKKYFHTDRPLEIAQP